MSDTEHKTLDDLVANEMGQKDLLILRQQALIVTLQAELRAAQELLANRAASRETEGA